jgi:hypothetical protein
MPGSSVVSPCSFSGFPGYLYAVTKAVRFRGGITDLHKAAMGWQAVSTPVGPSAEKSSMQLNVYRFNMTIVCSLQPTHGCVHVGASVCCIVTPCMTHPWLCMAMYRYTLLVLKNITSVEHLEPLVSCP